MPPRSAAPCDHSGITLLMELVCRYSSAARMMCQVRDHETKALCRRFSITPFRGRFRSSSSAVSAAADNLLAHLAVVPLVLEALGLDVTPRTERRVRCRSRLQLPLPARIDARIAGEPPDVVLQPTDLVRGRPPGADVSGVAWNCPLLTIR